MANADKVTPCLWFDGQARQAAEFYCSLLPDSHIVEVETAAADYPAGRQGDELVVFFVLGGRTVMGLNGGPHFQFNEAVSFQVACDDQAEVDRLWSALTADGGQESQCGWCKDRFGVSWQITPRRLTAYMADPDRAKAGRVMQAMMGMGKIIIADLDAAAAG